MVERPTRLQCLPDSHRVCFLCTTICVVSSYLTKHCLEGKNILRVSSLVSHIDNDSKRVTFDDKLGEFPPPPLATLHIEAIWNGRDSPSAKRLDEIRKTEI